MPATTNSTVLDTGHHDRRLARRLEDPEFRAVYERERTEIAAGEPIINSLERLRGEQHVSKAELAKDRQEFGSDSAASDSAGQPRAADGRRARRGSERRDSARSTQLE